MHGEFSDLAEATQVVRPELPPSRLTSLQCLRLQTLVVLIESEKEGAEDGILGKVNI